MQFVNVLTFHFLFLFFFGSASNMKFLFLNVCACSCVYKCLCCWHDGELPFQHEIDNKLKIECRIIQLYTHGWLVWCDCNWHEYKMINNAIRHYSDVKYGPRLWCLVVYFFSLLFPYSHRLLSELNSAIFFLQSKHCLHISANDLRIWFDTD